MKKLGMQQFCVNPMFLALISNGPKQPKILRMMMTGISIRFSFYTRPPPGASPGGGVFVSPTWGMVVLPQTYLLKRFYPRFPRLSCPILGTSAANGFLPR
jgi:hypothetical protein